MKNLSPQNHPEAKAPYEKTLKGRKIVVFADTVAYSPVSSQDPLHLAFIEPILTAAQANPSIPPAFVPLVAEALFYILKLTPDAIGIVSGAGYSGKRASSLLATLRHRIHGQAFAAEIIIAGSLIKDEHKDIPFAKNIRRVDFGVKLMPALANRETVEADILICGPDNARIGIDVKHSQNSVYRGVIKDDVLTGIANAIKAGEITSFYFVSNARFSNTLKTRISKVLSANVLPVQAITVIEALPYEPK